MKKDAKSIQRNLNKQEDIFAKAWREYKANITRSYKASNDQKFLERALQDKKKMQDCEKSTWGLVEKAISKGYGIQNQVYVTDGEAWIKRNNMQQLVGAIGVDGIANRENTVDSIFTNRWTVSVGNKQLNSQKGNDWSSEKLENSKQMRSDLKLIDRAAAKAESDIKKPGGFREKYRASAPNERNFLINSERTRIESEWNKVKENYKAGKISREEAIEKDAYYDALYAFTLWVHDGL